MGPQNQDHSFSLNKKEKKLALKCALSEKNQKDEIIIIDDLKISSQKLANNSFVEKAPKNIVDKEKTNYTNLKNDIHKIALTIESLK